MPKKLLKKIEKDTITADKKLEKKKIKNKILFNSLKEESPKKHINNIKKILEYIKSGDVFQVNLSREWYGKINKKYRASDIFSKLKKPTHPHFLVWLYFKIKQ